MGERLVPKVAPFVIPALIFLGNDKALIVLANIYFHSLKAIFFNKISACILIPIIKVGYCGCC